MQDVINKYPVVNDMHKKKEVFWLNGKCDGSIAPEITKTEIDDAEQRLKRFAPYIKSAFPDEPTCNGIIESPLIEINNMRLYFSKSFPEEQLEGKLFLKCDNLLPISGSIKARGGIYEVLCFAEKIALEKNMLKPDDNYSVFDSDKFREIFSRYSISVGSTGNLGLSIGIISAKLGFHVSVHMSVDAKQWKKDLLRKKGAEVVEYQGDYQKAVEGGRRQAAQNPNCHFVDDENSKTLFLGYTVAAQRLKTQIKEKNIIVDEQHPLLVYLPCGVGGGPGGIAFGLNHVFSNVHCFYVEPIQAPCMLLGLATGLHDKISVQDIGLSGKTCADGLAVGRASKLVGRLTENLIRGCFTLHDNKMLKLVKELYQREKIFVEPSAAAGLPGYYLSQKSQDFVSYIGQNNLDNATHIAWATGGNMVPEEERVKFLGDF